jgi:serine/threonine-protein kinase
MSPEQASAYEDVDGRADIYSLGAVAFYLLTGQPPFTSKNVLELLAAHRNEVVAPPSHRNAAVPADLDQIILKCMAKNVSARFQDADALRNALDLCSCANQWGPQEAATWWRPIEGTTKPERNEPEPAIDATVEYLSNCAPPNRDMASKVKRAHPEPD